MTIRRSIADNKAQLPFLAVSMRCAMRICDSHRFSALYGHSVEEDKQKLKGICDER